MADPNLHHETDGYSVQRRDQGLRRVSAATRWTVAAAAVGTAALGVTYTHLLPGKSSGAAAAQGAQQSTANCVLQPAAVVPAPAAAPAPHRDHEKGDEGENASDDEGSPNTVITATALQPPVIVCPTGGTTNGLTAPAQPPAPGQKAPQTRTGAS